MNRREAILTGIAALLGVPLAIEPAKSIYDGWSATLTTEGAGPMRVVHGGGLRGEMLQAWLNAKPMSRECQEAIAGIEEAIHRRPGGLGHLVRHTRNKE